MIATFLLSELATLDVRLSLNGEQIKVDAPKGKLTIDLIKHIRLNKPALLLELKFEEKEIAIKAMLRDASKDELFELDVLVDERAAIMEFDGGFSHNEANHQAELITLLNWFDDHMKKAERKAA